jgi:hypothetical protein
VGTPVTFQRCLLFIIATANKQFTLTAGKFVPVSNKTMMNVSECVYPFRVSAQSTHKRGQSANGKEAQKARSFFFVAITVY